MQPVRLYPTHITVTGEFIELELDRGFFVKVHTATLIKQLNTLKSGGRAPLDTTSRTHRAKKG